MNILILGSKGMLGSAIFRIFSSDKTINVFGVSRSNFYLESQKKNFFFEKNIIESEYLKQVFNKSMPDVVINCIGVIKQKGGMVTSEDMIRTNGIFPHNLYRVCHEFNSRLIHISSDCVFKGDKGNYSESDLCDAYDLYGMTKFLGELHYTNSVTLRTSIIGFEQNSNYSLLEWFLLQNQIVNGYSNAIFSGVTTLELAKIIKDIIIPNINIQGLYHISSEPISKFSLLEKLNIFFEKKIIIIKDSSFAINRSLNSVKFLKATGYSSPEWDKLIQDLISFGRNPN